MSTTPLEMRTTSAAEVELSARLRARWRILLTQGIAMIALGLLAIALPVVTTLATGLLIGALLFAGGAWRAVHVMRAAHAPGYGWSLALAALAMLLGAVMLIHPLPGVLSLTMLLAFLFVLEGIGKVMLALDLREHAHAWGWPLASGVTDLMLAALIVAGWPGTAAWVIGLLVGLNMAFFGVALTAVALAARRARETDLQRIASGGRHVPPQESRAAR